MMHAAVAVNVHVIRIAACVECSRRRRRIGRQRIEMRRLCDTSTRTVVVVRVVVDTGSIVGFGVVG